MKIENGRLLIETDNVEALRRAKQICFELSQLSDAGLLAITAGQAFMHLDDLCKAFDQVLQKAPA